MIIYLDGDNGPGSRTSGIAALGSQDMLYIYYSASNQHYRSAKRRSRLVEEARCPIKFIQTASTSNAVDFAISVDAAIACFTNVSEVVVLISEDKHFQTIANYLRTINPKASVCLEKNIHDAVLKYKLFDIKDLDSFRAYLCELQGHDAGAAFFNYLEDLFAEKAAYKNSKHIQSPAWITIIAKWQCVIFSKWRRIKQSKDEL